MGRVGKRLAAALLVAGVGLAVLFVSGGFLDRDPHWRFAARGPRRGVTALYFSGDMGLRHGMGQATARALAAHGVPVLGVSSSRLFRARRTRAETDAIIAGAVRDAAAQAGGDRLVLIGQSYGADVLGTGLGTLPTALRARVAAVILVVPGRDVFFRADPTGLAYHGTPDADGRAAIARLTWTPLTCIHGLDERDSACPGLRVPGATVIAMPGGHSLHRDGPALIAHVLAAVARVLPSKHRG